MSGSAIHVIRPNRGLFRLDLANLWKYRDLLRSFVQRDVTIRYRQTILGPTWLIVQPLAMTGVLTATIYGVAGLSTGGQPPELFYLIAMIVWSYFSQVVMAVSQVFIINEYLFGKVYFPRIVVPLSSAASNLVGLLIQLVPLAILIAIRVFHGHFHFDGSRLWVLPLAFLQLLFFSLGIGLIIASSTAKYRDLANATPFALQAWLFLTPVLYTFKMVPAALRVPMAFFNPLSVVVDLWRFGILGTGAATPVEIALSTVSTLIVLSFGILLFQYVERTAADTI